MKNYRLLIAAMTLFAACSKEGEQSAPVSPGIAVRHFDAESVARGSQVFEKHCAVCHGPQAQGHPDWQTPSDGSFSAAPPLNGTGNDWKLSRAKLAAIILNGARRQSDNIDVMPAWKGRLSEREIDDVINWMQSLWPPEVYEAWSKSQAVALPKS